MATQLERRWIRELFDHAYDVGAGELQKMARLALEKDAEVSKCLMLHDVLELTLEGRSVAETAKEAEITEEEVRAAQKLLRVEVSNGSQD